MKVAKTISSLPDMPSPVCLAVGTFDGVHLGHVKLINEMNKHGTSLVFTFSNHPSDILQNAKSIPSLMSPKHKERALAKAGVQYCVIQPFTQDIAQMPYNLFLEEIHAATPFSHIFFGENDTLGKNREGTPEKIAKLGEELGFEAHYLPKVTINGVTISSSNVRKALLEGKLKLAEDLLGSSYSNEVKTNDPYLDPGLIKPGRYVAAFLDNFETPVEIDNEGNLKLTKIPEKLKKREHITISLKEAP